MSCGIFRFYAHRTLLAKRAIGNPTNSACPAKPLRPGLGLNELGPTAAQREHNIVHEEVHGHAAEQA